MGIRNYLERSLGDSPLSLKRTSRDVPRDGKGSTLKLVEQLETTTFPFAPGLIEEKFKYFIENQAGLPLNVKSIHATPSGGKMSLLIEGGIKIPLRKDELPLKIEATLESQNGVLDIVLDESNDRFTPIMKSVAKEFNNEMEEEKKRNPPPVISEPLKSEIKDIEAPTTLETGEEWTLEDAKKMEELLAKLERRIEREEKMLKELAQEEAELLSSK